MSQILWDINSIIFMAFLASVYQSNGHEAPDIDLMKADRMDYLNKLGMAYIDQNIDAEYLSLVTE